MAQETVNNFALILSILAFCMSLSSILYGQWVRQNIERYRAERERLGIGEYEVGE